MSGSKTSASRRARVVLAGSVLGMLLAGSGCATGPNRVPHDPLEPMNRGIFWFNEQLDRWILEPVAIGYDFVLPERAQDSVGNFFDNLRFPVVLANDVLQGKLRQAGVDVGRFGINTTVGILGLFDPATGWGLEASDEDFGQTLGRWGVGPGPYLVIPIFGPSGLRDLLATPVDGVFSVVNYVVDTPIVLGARGLQAINTRARFLEEVRENRKMAFDYYVFIRDAYRDLRQNQVEDGAGSRDDEDDLYFPEPQ